MSVHVARSVPDALEYLARYPDAQVLAGGTDFMVEVNFRHRSPTHVLAIGQLAELRTWTREADMLTVGAGVTYTAVERSGLATLVPALAQASRTVGSPQIRNAGTIGGNIGTGSPAGDTLPVLAALDAAVVLQSMNGERELPLTDFVVGVKRTALEPGELIVAVRMPVLNGPQEYLKIGTRNAMVISVAGIALVVDQPGQTVRVGLGAVNATPTRAKDAESWIAGEVDWSAMQVSHSVAQEFGQRVAAVSAPIDDHRSSARYRAHGVQVMATRALQRAFPS